MVMLLNYSKVLEAHLQSGGFSLKSAQVMHFLSLVSHVEQYVVLQTEQYPLSA